MSEHLKVEQTSVGSKGAGKGQHFNERLPFTLLCSQDYYKLSFRGVNAAAYPQSTIAGSQCQSLMQSCPKQLPSGCPGFPAMPALAKTRCRMMSSGNRLCYMLPHIQLPSLKTPCQNFSPGFECHFWLSLSQSAATLCRHSPAKRRSFEAVTESLVHVGKMHAAIRQIHQSSSPRSNEALI